MNAQKDQYRSSRVCYIVAAAAEYFISILVGSTYLAKLASSIGLDDGTVGVITSFLALGCGFQIVALLFKPSMRIKPLAIAANLVNQLCFTFLYLLPLIKLPHGARSTLFIILLLLGNVILNIVFSPKVIWTRSLIDGNKLGRFSATNEMISLSSGMIFTMVMGAVIDALEARGRLMLAFVICGIVLLVLTFSHTLMLLLMKEPPQQPSPADGERALLRIRGAITDRSTLLLLPIFILWNVTLYITTPFFGTYQLNELGFSMTFVSVLSVAYAIVRALASRPLGALGDKHSFVTSLSVAYVATTLGLLVLSLGGRVNYIIYYMLHAITLAASNSGQLNLIYEYVSPQKRSGAVAILYTVGGFVGFFSTMAVRPLVNCIQAQGNKFLFIDGIYAQQVLAIFGAIIALLCLLYINLVVRKLPKPHGLILKGEN